MKKFLFLFNLILLCPLNAVAQNYLDKATVISKKKIELFCKQNDIPGMAISISYSGKFILSEGVGFADLEKKIKVNPSSTKFRIASVTKIITALTLMKLNELDSLNIDNSIHFYLDNLPHDKYNFSLRQLAGHLSGLKRNPSKERWDSYNTYSEDDLYQSLKDDDLDSKPGVQFSYSNYGYKVLGLIIEKKCHKTIVECQEEFILNKLNMTNTIPDTGLSSPNTTNFYLKKDGLIQQAPYMDCKLKYAQGCHLSTSEDLMHLGNLFFQPNLVFNNIRPLQIMTKQQVLFSGSKTGYGLGIISNKDMYGNFFLGHNGLENGSRAIFRVYPKYNLVISILINNQEPPLEDLITEIAYIYIENLKKIKKD
ncbi:serine hydrolase domain-containing protein [Chryseobacterium sp.]|uniref:serine hydrolase domain-containing protein n=1 Tax=Chryseobacterium sp. TaxID=1871047 RepID=UPI0031D4621C